MNSQDDTGSRTRFAFIIIEKYILQIAYFGLSANRKYKNSHFCNFFRSKNGCFRCQYTTKKIFGQTRSRDLNPHDKSELTVLIFVFPTKSNFAVLTLKVSDTLTNQMQNLPVSGASLILCNIVEFVVQLRVNLNSQMLVVLISHKSPQNILI